MKHSRTPRQIFGLALATAVIASGVVGCSTGEPEQVTEDVYCATEDGTIIDEKYCDDGYSGSGGGFIWIGGFGGGYGPGYRLPANQRTGPPIRYNDSAARTQAGLPAKGRVTGTGGMGGKVTRPSSKGGGFGGGTRAGSGSGGGSGTAKGSGG